MKKGQAKSVVQRVEELAEKRRKSIIGKCRPALFELAPLWKDSIIAFQTLGRNAPKELVAEIKHKFAKRLEEIQRKYSGPHPPAPNTFAAQAIFRNEANMSDADGIADWIHFERQRMTLRGGKTKSGIVQTGSSALSATWNNSVAGSAFALSRATWNINACSKTSGASA